MLRASISGSVMDLCTSFDDLPDGLVVDILSRLPVKTLVQSTCINKLWYSLIKNPSFISVHLSRSISDPSNCYIFLVHKCSPPLVVTVVSDDNRVLTCHPKLILPLKTMTDTLVIGTCNGLLCLTDSDDMYHKYYGRHIYLINPFIHKYKRLSAESSSYPDFISKIDGIRSGNILVSFGYSKADNDYKIFRILIRYVVNDPTETPTLLTKVEIYSLNTGRWKGMDALVDQVPIHCSPTSVNGCLYWLPKTKDGPLLCFDLKSEVFSKINLPTAYAKLCFPWSFRIREKNGSVALYTMDLLSNFPSKRFCLLVLEKYTNGLVEWKEFYYETAESIPSNCMGFSGCGRLIYVNSNWPMNELIIVAADLDDSFAIEKLEIEFTNGFTGAINVMESLVMFSD